MQIVDPSLPARLMIAYGLIALLVAFVSAWTFVQFRRYRLKRRKLFGYRR